MLTATSMCACVYERAPTTTTPGRSCPCSWMTKAAEVARTWGLVELEACMQFMEVRCGVGATPWGGMVVRGQRAGEWARVSP